MTRPVSKKGIYIKTCICVKISENSPSVHMINLSTATLVLFHTRCDLVSNLIEHAHWPSNLVPGALSEQEITKSSGVQDVHNDNKYQRCGDYPREALCKFCQTHRRANNSNWYEGSQLQSTSCPGEYRKNNIARYHIDSMRKVSLSKSWSRWNWCESSCVPAQRHQLCHRRPMTYWESKEKWQGWLGYHSWWQ